MKEIRTEIQLPATPDKVWSLLMNFGEWEGWNKNFRVKGNAAMGHELKVSVANGKGGWKTYPAMIVKFDRPFVFRWRATMMAGFLFSNDRVFELEATEGGTKLIHKEEFSGLMVTLFWGKMCSFVERVLNEMNADIESAIKDESQASNS